MSTYNVWQGRAYRQNPDGETMTRVSRNEYGRIREGETIPVPWGALNLIIDATDTDLEHAGYSLAPAVDVVDVPTSPVQPKKLNP